MADEEIIATLRASAVRRFIGVGTMMGLGALELYLALTSPMAFVWQAFLIVMSGCALYVSFLMWKATAMSIHLTTEGLRDSDGNVLARVEDVKSVERSALSIKPSNGFMIRMKERQPMGWRPGMWWRMGRMVAVGGVTPASQSKPMADILAAMMAERNGDGA